jgi:hypothetical protein
VVAAADEQQAMIVTDNVSDYPIGVQLLSLAQ